MTPKEAFKQWMNSAGSLDRIPVVGYRETRVGITIILSNGTGIPYPYAYDEDICSKLLLD